jgi:hypothetical protein
MFEGMLGLILLAVMALGLLILAAFIVLMLIWGFRRVLITFADVFIFNPILFLLFLPFPLLVIPFLIGFFLEPIDAAVEEGATIRKIDQVKALKEHDIVKERNADLWEEKGT